ncbi:MAG TPA: EMC3/TMCO1 family protein [Candidatus Thermoplasmatota archaeon]|jgi:uncharacterized membrane protein (DUF106 family)|nr:EMC3/TMCO1 family protein [Candidatus Thermoplasmatota archaeon]
MASKAPVAPPAPKSMGSTFLLLITFGAVFLILFNPELSAQIGRYVGFVLEPIIGFGREAPVLTIFGASIIMVVTTTVIRHFFTDWVKMARTQEIMRAFQKEFSEARKSNNSYRMKKLTEQQPELMQHQMEMQGQTMKPMAFTMLVVIPIFAWLGHYLLTFPTAPVDQLAQCGIPIQMPWNDQWMLLGPRDCPGDVATHGSWWILPHWVLLYSLFSIPFGTLTMRALKLWEFRHVDLDQDGVPAGKGAA